MFLIKKECNHYFSSAVSHESVLGVVVSHTGSPLSYDAPPVYIDNKYDTE